MNGFAGEWDSVPFLVGTLVGDGVGVGVGIGLWVRSQKGLWTRRVRARVQEAVDRNDLSTPPETADGTR